MTALGKIRAIVLSLVLAVSAVGGWQDAQAVEGYLQLTSSDISENRPIRLGVNKSLVVELPRPAGDVLVSNPQIADAVLRTSQRLYLIGVKLGQANVFLFDSSGGQIASFDIFVEADLAGLNQLLAEAIPGGYVRADAMNGNIVLRGQVASASDSSRAEEVTLGMVQGLDIGTEEEGSSNTSGMADKKVVNLLTITGEEQVALKVTIAEVQREVAKQLGINITGDYNGDDFNFGTDSGNASGVGFSPLGASSGISASPGEIGLDFTTGNLSIEATLRALDETNMIRTLAEPTLTAVSGETAEFLAGGEYPFLTDGGDNEPDTVEFKEFGVKLAFTPVVLAPGRISLKVRTSVSEITGSFESVPILSTRRAETTVEMPSGGAFAIGGMMQSSTRRQASGFPFLRDLPILGALFSSKDFQESQTELVIIITPYLVKPTSPQNLARPDENLAMSSDAQAYFMNRLTKVYGTAGTAPAGPSAAKVGFSFD